MAIYVCEESEKEFSITFSYDTSIIARIKQIEGREISFICESSSKRYQIFIC